MPLFLALITSVAAALIGDLFHSAAAGFAALVVISIAVISVSVVARRRQEATA